MPELPEVETTLCGIQPHILQQKITKVTVRHHGLRWPVPENLPNLLKNKTILSVSRRAKYLLLETTQGTLILHLGMSGSLRILTEPTPAQKHDHIDIEFAHHKVLRFTDPRRFGAALWTTKNPLQHSLLKNLGPEPFSEDFSGAYLWKCAAEKKVAVKSFLMDNKIVVGVGNIYATESLFAAGIDPRAPAKNISEERYNKLALSVKTILQKAIKLGGTTLKDFVDSDGKPGYFSMQLKVYGREGLPCVKCKMPLKALRLGQRNTVYCEKCQM
ncbi:MAG: bifunctional DNA-formamidopyrimidine glycosylase/DNA-(apurinic or apyrimidinic site) lyase [Gammaproteobacteria bacterium]